MARPGAGRGGGGGVYRRSRPRVHIVRRRIGEIRPLPPRSTIAEETHRKADQQHDDDDLQEQAQDPSEPEAESSTEKAMAEQQSADSGPDRAAQQAAQEGMPPEDRRPRQAGG